MGHDLEIAEYVSFLALFYPIILLMRFFMGIKTNRKGAYAWRLAEWLELIQFFCVIEWIRVQNFEDQWSTSGFFAQITKEFLDSNDKHKDHY